MLSLCAKVDGIDALVAKVDGIDVKVEAASVVKRESPVSSRAGYPSLLFLSPLPRSPSFPLLSGVLFLIPLFYYIFRGEPGCGGSISLFADSLYIFISTLAPLSVSLFRTASLCQSLSFAPKAQRYTPPPSSPPQ